MKQKKTKPQTNKTQKKSFSDIAYKLIDLSLWEIQENESLVLCLQRF